VTKLPACVVAMEACCGAHHLGRLLVAQGHEIRLMSPEYVRPYIKAQKNDDRDAEGRTRPPPSTSSGRRILPTSRSPAGAGTICRPCLTTSRVTL
jgi:hypothetical protein